MYNIWFDISYRESFSINLAQQQAAGDITLAGVEMVAGADDEVIPTSIICTQIPGYGAQCWIFDPWHYSETLELCKWTGNQYTFCVF